MKKLSLQLRLTLLTAALLALACLVVYLFISNSALMHMDEIENQVVSIELTGSEEALNLDLAFLLPEIQTTIRTAKHSFQVQCLTVTLIIILVGSALTWILSGIVLRPLRRLTGTIGSITENNLSTPIPEPNTDDELAQLTVSFNRMLSRLDSAFRSQKQFTANAAHELRTPLAVIQTDLEVLQKKDTIAPEEFRAVTARTLSQVSRLGNLVNTLLELLSLHTVPLDNEVELQALAEEVLCDLASPAAKKDITLQLCGTDCTLRGSDALLYRAVYNLTENAIKYSPEGTRVTLSVLEHGIEVTDEGPGIPREAWEHIFDAFYRVDKARSRVMGGAGLGLALVKNIAEVHGGSVYVVRSDSTGTTIRLCLDRGHTDAPVDPQQ